MIDRDHNRRLKIAEKLLAEPVGLADAGLPQTWRLQLIEWGHLGYVTRLHGPGPMRWSLTRRGRTACSELTAVKQRPTPMW